MLVEDEGGRWAVDLEAVVARRVRRLREEFGLTQAEFGRRLANHGPGMQQTTVARLEAGARPIRLNEVAAMAHVFDVHPSALWRMDEEPLTVEEADDLAVQFERQLLLLEQLREAVEAEAEERRQLEHRHEVSARALSKAARAVVNLRERLARSPGGLELVDQVEREVERGVKVLGVDVLLGASAPGDAHGAGVEGPLTASGPVDGDGDEQVHDPAPSRQR